MLPDRLLRAVAAATLFVLAVGSAAVSQSDLPAAESAAPVKREAPPQPGGARWIWGGEGAGLGRPEGERCAFRRVVVLTSAPKRARFVGTADNHFELRIGGRIVARGDEWREAVAADVASALVEGANVIAVLARNDGGPAGLIGWLEGEDAQGKPFRIQTDAGWKASLEPPAGWDAAGFDDASWPAARDLGPAARAPWSEVSWHANTAIEVPPGFAVDTAASGIGSLIALARGGTGEVFVSVEGGGILRLSVDGDGDGGRYAAAPYSAAIRNAQGLCWSRGALHAVGEGPEGTGLYRIDPEDPRVCRRLLAFGGEGGEHGPHGVVEGPDGRLYVTVGNHASVPEPWSAASPYRISYEGHVLPRLLDPQGHALQVKAPAGVVVSLAPDGSDVRLFAGGFRNVYDIAFNAHGDLFAFDSDMEWDIGLPWYRPVRLYHVVPGGEYGSRTGSTPWCGDYPDMLPAAEDVGRGSPTGLVLYDGTRFPARYRGTILGGDWSQGRIVAFFLDAAGTTYAARSEVLVSGRPLNVTDLVVDADGSVLFTTGGRGTRGALYRLRCTAPAADSLDDTPLPPAARRVSFDAATPPRELASAAKHGDRFESFLASRELERRELASWPGQDVSRDELMIALARRGIAAGRDLSREADADWGCTLENAIRACGYAKVVSLRALELALLVPGFEPPADWGRRLLAIYPTRERAADHELAMLLARLAPPGALDRLVAAFESESSRSERIHIAYALRAIRDGWTPAHFDRLIPWLLDAAAGGGGQCYAGYLAAIRKDLEARMDEATRERWRARAAAAETPAATVVLDRSAPRRDLDQTLAVVRRIVDSPRRSAAEGKRVFTKLCAACHTFGTEGGRVGPELTRVASRFVLDDLLDAVMLPSRQIPDQYRAHDVFTKDQRLITGIMVENDAAHVTIVDGTGARIEIPAAEIDEKRVAKTSAMPDGLVDGLSVEEIADLCAWLLRTAPAGAPEPPPWRALFDGQTLDGWAGDESLWSVANRCIVGEASGLPASSFLQTKESFGDFCLEFDVELAEGNSGLQFRSKPGEPWRLAGYQADLGEAYWGSLYEEGGRGMLLAADREAWKPYLFPRGWNHVVVEARGPRLTIELNGVPTADVRDDAASAGHFGLQLHAGGRTGVRFRNLRLRN